MTLAQDAPKITVVVVDDSALVRSLLSEIINRQPDMACVGTAADPYAAREVIRTLNPDVITLDVEMPKMDGLDFLSKLMRLRPMPVVMVSTLTERGADVTLKALELGAVDFVAKPKIGLSDGLRALAEEITEKIRVASSARVHRMAAAAPVAFQAAPNANVQGALQAALQTAPQTVLTPSAQGPVIFIGASTGGTEATKEVLLGLPLECPPVLIAQHMPAGFTSSYARRLNQQVALKVKEAEHHEPLLCGHAYIAPGGRHLAVARKGERHVAELLDTDPVNRHRPSVEVLFESAARVLGPQAIGIMLTGMGGDGARAMRAMREAGAYNLCQDESTCVVFGMPREAIKAQAVHEVVALKQLASRVLKHLSSRATPPRASA